MRRSDNSQISKDLRLAGGGADGLVAFSKFSAASRNSYKVITNSISDIQAQLLTDLDSRYTWCKCQHLSILQTVRQPRRAIFIIHPIVNMEFL